MDLGSQTFADSLRHFSTALTVCLSLAAEISWTSGGGRGSSLVSGAWPDSFQHAAQPQERDQSRWTSHPCHRINERMRKRERERKKNKLQEEVSFSERERHTTQTYSALNKQTGSRWRSEHLGTKAPRSSLNSAGVTVCGHTCLSEWEPILQTCSSRALVWLQKATKTHFGLRTQPK